MGKTVTRLTAAIFAAAFGAASREEDLPEEQVVDFKGKTGLLCGHGRKETAMPVEIRSGQRSLPLARSEASIDPGVWQFNSPDAGRVRKIEQGRKKMQVGTVRGEDQGRLATCLAQSLQGRAETGDVELCAPVGEGSGIEQQRHRAESAGGSLELGRRRSAVNLDRTPSLAQLSQQFRATWMQQGLLFEGHEKDPGLDQATSDRAR